jgi:hypothetical protein
MTTDVRIRLLSKAEPITSTGCLEWQASKSGDGYGRFWFEGRMQNAHRISLELHTGERIPDGMMVLHRCDNKTCINPEHLTIGTHADNMRDRHAKRRFSRKLSDVDVAAIRAAPSARQKDLARAYGVSQQQISHIKTGRQWT